MTSVVHNNLKMKIKHVVSISGGKDSTALMLLALEIMEKRGDQFIFVFADTGNENDQTLEYIEYLQSVTGQTILKVKPDLSHMIKNKRWVVDTKWRREGVSDTIINAALGELIPSGNPFLDLCMAKGRFPSRMAQFCTQHLKAEAISNEVFMPLLRDGYKICSWQGVRAEESPKRAKDPVLQQTDKGIWAFRPIKYWRWQQVFDQHKRFGIAPNPLYTQGMSRVGCMPCVNCNKAELKEVAKRFPHEIDRIREWEKRVGKCSKRGAASFFANPKRGLDEPTIDHKTEWARTGHGGRQFTMHDEMIEETAIPSCSSAYGLCE